MFEKRPKIVTLDSIGELCKPVSHKRSYKVEHEKIIESKKILSKPEKVETKKSEEIILWL